WRFFIAPGLRRSIIEVENCDPQQGDRQELRASVRAGWGAAGWRCAQRKRVLCVLVGVWVAGGGNARLVSSRFRGLSCYRVAAFGLSGLRESDILFITVSHCAWQRVISLSLATK